MNVERKEFFLLVLVASAGLRGRELEVLQVPELVRLTEA
jgi:hypothetical protein